jgi:hypothetical protein
MAARTNFLIIFLCLCARLYAQDVPLQQDTAKQKIQEQDTTRQKFIDKIQNTKASQAFVHSITRSNRDTVFNHKSEDAFLPFQGKIIRHIYINHIGFDKTMYDTTRSIKNTVTKIGNALHSNTRDWVIKDNLFIKEGKRLNPYTIADNERYLRDLDFILDARIKVQESEGDSVDLIVVTRDVFSLGATFNPHSANNYAFKIRDTNLAGWGQRLLFNGVFDASRNPMFGPEISYTKNSVGGSLTSLSVGYTTLNTASSYGEENEYAGFVRLDRPLVSPYTRIAGGFELSHNWSQNVYTAADSLFKKYNYDVGDCWIGYNIGINNIVKNRTRHFVAVRAFEQKFINKPLQPAEIINPIYNSKTYVLGEFGFFRQNFYKTRFIYGFGRTEDVPYGERLSFLAGWVQQLNMDRLYLGAEFERTLANKKGDFYQYLLRAESYHFQNNFQDIGLLASASLNSRLHVYRKIKMRQYFRVGYTSLIERTTNPYLLLNNDFGVSGLKSDSLKGTQRLSFHSETVIFTNWKLLGFKFAPLAFTDVAFLSKEHQHIFYNEPYYGIGLGIRTRNENLVFGTIEARCTLFPRIAPGGSHFNFSIRSNLRIKSTGTLVKAPSFIQYN